MAEVSATAAGILAYSATAGTMSAQVTSAAAAATACGPAVLTPVFGAIGSEFLAAFTGTHSAHTAALARLAEVLGSIGSAAAGSAAGYQATDAAAAGRLL
ncbi:hypothetical protein E5720_03525 [Rhodococcus sp. PAMC28707]|uniref:type VII secretion target n=1 Tax=unclassified Rhodococcus (in: high G+C Gram-positive bacteria) TaxID=192944 RepID=UPI00109E01F6|nr:MULTISPECIES: type VII secretion target [unclassified Rhodococcus (in: high G+C Gram-positive bacteria)]QCB50614.1 hypothetical protein E5769_10490 [Rhodococcus sp. PAMC28705]QCB57694.1 hypothetical protein E5720_03525 [Rhodococcus sp. PAMC28707]